MPTLLCIARVDQRGANRASDGSVQMFPVSCGDRTPRTIREAASQQEAGSTRSVRKPRPSGRFGARGRPQSGRGSSGLTLSFGSEASTLGAAIRSPPGGCLARGCQECFCGRLAAPIFLNVFALAQPRRRHFYGHHFTKRATSERRNSLTPVSVRWTCTRPVSAHFRTVAGERLTAWANSPVRHVSSLVASALRRTAVFSVSGIAELLSLRPLCIDWIGSA